MQPRRVRSPDLSDSGEVSIEHPPFSLYLITDRKLAKDGLVAACEEVARGRADVSPRRRGAASREGPHRDANCSPSRASCAKSAPRMAPCSSSTIASMLPSRAMPMASIFRRIRFQSAMRANCLVSRSSSDVSTHSIAEVEAANRAGANFVVFGPVYDPISKSANGPPARHRCSPRGVRAERHSSICAGRHYTGSDRGTERLRDCRRRRDRVCFRGTLARPRYPTLAASDLRSFAAINGGPCRTLSRTAVCFDYRAGCGSLVATLVSVMVELIRAGCAGLITSALYEMVAGHHCQIPSVRISVSEAGMQSVLSRVTSRLTSRVGWPHRFR